MFPLRKAIFIGLGLILFVSSAKADLCSYTCTEQHRVRIADAQKKQKEVLEELNKKRSAYQTKWNEYLTAHRRYRISADEYNVTYKGTKSPEQSGAKREVEQLAASAQAAYAATLSPKTEAQTALEAYKKLDAKVIQADLGARYAQCRAECETTYYLQCSVEIKCQIERHSVEIGTGIVTTEMMPLVVGHHLDRTEFPVKQSQLHSTIDRFVSELEEEAELEGPEACSWVAEHWTRTGFPPVEGRPVGPLEDRDNFTYQHSALDYVPGPADCKYKTRRQ